MVFSKAELRSLNSLNEYTVGWISALPIERAAAMVMFEEEHAKPLDFEQSAVDSNSYAWGCIAGHNIVIASLPAGMYGTTSAATVAISMLSSFPQIRFGLMVGIGAGIPSGRQDIRLGDIVVSQPGGKYGGVIQHDRKKMKASDEEERHGYLNSPPQVLLTALSNLQSRHEYEEARVSEYLQHALKSNPLLARSKPGKPGYIHQGFDHDRLFEATYKHVGGESCQLCDSTRQMPRIRRESAEPEIHYGIIASGNALIKDAAARDKLKEELGEDCICLETEAAGLMNAFPCLVIRGICDYADSHKNDQWQPYSSATAAAFAKEFLTYVARREVSKAKRATDTLNDIDSRRAERERKVSAFLRALYTCPYAERKNRNRRHIKGTCKWFIDHRLFKDWRDSSSSTPLWVSADPGCGKSVLARYLVDEVFTGGIICYFFFKDDFVDQRSSANAVCALLRQLFLQRRDLINDSILQKFEDDGDRYIQSFSDLWNTYCSTLADQSLDILCILDALDECQEVDRHELIEAITYADFTGSTKSKVKFLMTSRPYHDIQRAFQGLESPNHLLTIHLSGENEDEAKKIAVEINMVIKHRVLHIGEEKSLQSDECTFLYEQLTSVRHRTYLWVYLILDIIQNTPGFARGNIRRIIKDIPGTVDEAYERILGRSPNEKSTRKLLHLVVGANRPLTVDEISTALVIREDHKSYGSLQDEIDPDPAQRQNIIRHLCGLFVIIVDSRVYLLHQTAREFLVEYSTSAHSRHFQNWKHSLRWYDSNRVLAEACIWYINLMRLEGPPDSFLIYSAMNWDAHFRKANIQQHEKLAGIAFKLCNIQATEYGIWSAVRRSEEPYFPSLSTEEISAPSASLIVVSFLGLEGVAVQLLHEAPKTVGWGWAALQPGGKELDVNAKDTHGETALLYAVRGEHEPLVKLLLENGARINTRGRCWETPLIIAVGKEHEAIARLLLERGAKADVEDSHYRTPLVHAAEFGNDTMAQLLLEHGADVNARLKFYVHTALEAASRYGHETLVCMLLEHGVKVKDGGLALHAASEHGHRKIVKILLEHGAEVNAQSMGKSALLIASNEGHEKIVQVLLDHGAEVNAESIFGTALVAASEAGHIGIVQMLLDHGADVNIIYGWRNSTALVAASEAGHIGIVQMLLDHGADVNIICGLQNSTALQEAMWKSKDDNIVQILLDHGAEWPSRDDIPSEYVDQNSLEYTQLYSDPQSSSRTEPHPHICWPSWCCQPSPLPVEKPLPGSAGGSTDSWKLTTFVPISPKMA